jgi:hypothetical protein
MADGSKRVTDVELDDELRSLLDVAPSAEFVPRVRMCIAGRQPGLFLPTWLKTSAVVAGVAALALAIGFGPYDLLPGPTSSESTSVQGDRSVIGRNIPLATPARARAVPPVMPPSQAPRPGRGRPPVASDVARLELLSSVMFSPDVADAYRRLFASVSEAAYEVPEPSITAADDMAMTDIEIAPVEIEPLDPSTVHRGVLQ